MTAAICGGVASHRIAARDFVRRWRNTRHCEEPLRRSNPDRLRGKTLDCFAEPVIGPRFARTRWLAMTGVAAGALLTRHHPAIVEPARQPLFAIDKLICYYLICLHNDPAAPSGQKERK
ncbi:hypothetical protein EOW77_0015450 [Bradyrhizobium yuanmingense]|nr:hypothetical protein EOW77_0015450 [Bradyrhizobium yuanmingense]